MDVAGDLNIKQNSAKPQITVLISGRGSNMQAIHSACINGCLEAELSHVISNVPDAAGLQYAQRHQIHTSVVDHRDYTSREAFDKALIETIESSCPPTLVLLAGFMRRLTANFTRHFSGRLINIHPSLLPAHPGLDTHSKVLAAGDRWHGCSVHYVNEELDGGPVIARGVVPVLAGDSEEILAARVLSTEHRLYPAITQLCIHGGAECQNSHVKFNQVTLSSPLLYCYDQSTG